MAKKYSIFNLKCHLKRREGMKTQKMIKIIVYSISSLIAGGCLSIHAQAGNLGKSGVFNPNSSACSIASQANAFKQTYTCSNCKHFSKEGPNTWIITCQFNNVVILKNSSLQLYDPRSQNAPSCFYGKHHANYAVSVSEAESTNKKGLKIGKILLTCSGGKD